jgi:hypothetical protein
MIFLRTATLVVILTFLGSCGIRDSKKNPCELDTEVRPITLMVDELSYSQLENYVGLFSDSSFHWIERLTYPDKGGLTVDRFELRGKFRGHTGKLEYVFYFRRLAEMRFHPDNISDFFQAAKSEGLPASNGAKLIVGDLEYWATRRHGAEFFGVADGRISRLTSACIVAHD